MRKSSILSPAIKIHLIRPGSPAQYSLTMQNRGLKHQSYSFYHSMFILNIHLVSPGCPRPSIALQCRIMDYNINCFSLCIFSEAIVRRIVFPELETKLSGTMSANNSAEKKEEFTLSLFV